MRRLLAVSGALALVSLACEDLNRPMAHPSSQPRHECLTDVECPSSMKCMKGPQDIQGICSHRTESSPAADAGATPGLPKEAPPAPAPAPGDISI